MEKIFYHIDVNSAFLSWEASYRVNILGDALDLRTVPAVVGGDQGTRHGIVLAKSLPTKLYSIQTGEPLVSAQKKCPELIIATPNYPMYVQTSKALMDLLKQFTPSIHQYSIDEAFLDMTGTSFLWGAPTTAALLIKDTIKEELGFTVNIGISSNKLLAKMASDFTKPDRIHTLFPNEMPTKMWPLPVEDLFFVGHATKQKLRTYGIRTIGELAACDPEWIKSTLKAHGYLIWQFANGIDIQLDKFTMSPVNKGYGNSITISFDIKDIDTAKLVLLSLAETVSARIRADNALISVIAISIVDYNFERSNHQMKLSSPTNVTRRIYEAACTTFIHMWNHTPIRQLGLHTSKATHDGSYQYSIFDSFNIEKEIKLNKAIDSIRDTWGEDAIMRSRFVNSANKHGISHMSGGLDKSRRTGMTKGFS